MGGRLRRVEPSETKFLGASRLQSAERHVSAVESDESDWARSPILGARHRLPRHPFSRLKSAGTHGGGLRRSELGEAETLGARCRLPRHPFSRLKSAERHVSAVESGESDWARSPTLGRTSTPTSSVQQTEVCWHPWGGLRRFGLGEAETLRPDIDSRVIRSAD